MPNMTGDQIRTALERDGLKRNWRVAVRIPPVPFGPVTELVLYVQARTWQEAHRLVLDALDKASIGTIVEAHG